MKMATIIEENVIIDQLQKEVETLRETDRKLGYQEICCQKAKELFLLKHLATNRPEMEKSKHILPEECQKDIQFSEILALLLEIKKQKRRLLMLKQQLHCKQVKQEVGVLDDILQRQSEMLVGLKTVKERSPLAFWYSEMVHTLRDLPKQNHKGKFSEMNQLFFNVHYKNGEKEPHDLLAEEIRKKKIKHNKRTKDVVEKLQFFTCYKGFCTQIVISKISHDVRRNEDGKHADDNVTAELAASYRCYSDIGLNDLQEHLLEELYAKRPPEVFVREYVWKEVEKLTS